MALASETIARSHMVGLFVIVIAQVVVNPPTYNHDHNDTFLHEWSDGQVTGECGR
jgi:hypothetical protein